VRVSPYEFGTKSAYPASTGLDISACRHLSIEVEDEEGEDLRDLARQLGRLEQLENELSLAQRWVQGRVTDVRDKFDEAVEDGEGRLYAELVSALTRGPLSVRSLVREVEAPPELVEDALDQLADEKVVERTDDGWQLR